jgi:hypothetical protein
LTGEEIDLTFIQGLLQWFICWYYVLVLQCFY